MHERIVKKTTPIPTVDYFAAFNLPLDTPIEVLESFCARIVKNFHPDGKSGIPATPEELERAVKIYNEVKALRKDPEALRRYREQCEQRTATKSQVENGISAFDDQRIGNLRIRTVKRRGLVAANAPQYMLVDPASNEVMGSRAFDRVRLVGKSLVGTYSAGLGQRDILIDPESGDTFGTSFQKMLSRHDMLFGENYGVYHRIDPVTGSILERAVDIRV
jgi:hypothetical protein